jgi:hypothetical protein
MTEDGPQPELLRDVYGLVECDGGYDHRTELNVRDADATVVFARDPDSNGTRLTLELAQRHAKPCVVNPTGPQLAAFVEEHGVEVLNVAGNRESVAPGIGAEAERVVIEALSATD